MEEMPRIEFAAQKQLTGVLWPKVVVTPSDHGTSSWLWGRVKAEVRCGGNDHPASAES
jgi:hypothetical protein